MSLEVRCGQCGKLYVTKDSLAGKKLRCKACGAVINVPLAGAAAAPAPAAGKTATPAAAAAAARPAPTPPRPRHAPPPAARAQSQAPQPPPPPPAEPDENPFGDLDALASMEPEEGLAPDGTDPNEPNDPTLFRRPRGASYVPLAGEETIDRIVPWAITGLFVIFLITAAVRGISGVSEQAERLHLRTADKAAAVGRVGGFALAILVCVAGVAAPLHLAGVVLASKLQDFRNRSWLYLKCLAVAATPWIVALAITGFSLEQSFLTGIFFAGVPVALAVMWLLLRLKPAPFAIAAGLALMLGVALPALIGRTIGAPSLVATGTADATAASSPKAGGGGGGGGGSGSSTPPLVAPLPEASTENPAAIPERLTEIFRVLNAYAAEHEGRYPPGLDTIYKDDLLVIEDATHTPTRLTCFVNSRWRTPLPPKLIVATGSPVKPATTAPATEPAPTATTEPATAPTTEPSTAPFKQFVLLGSGDVKELNSPNEFAAAKQESLAAEQLVRRQYVEARAKESASEQVEFKRETPKGGAMAWWTAYHTGDVEEVKSMTVNVPYELLETSMSAVAAARALQDAAAQAFIDNPQPGLEPTKTIPELAREARALEPRVSPDGETADVPGTPFPMKLKKEDAVWKVDGTGPFGKLTEKQAKLATITHRLRAAALGEVMQAVTDKKYATYAEALKAVDARLAELQQNDGEYQEALRAP